MPTSRKIRQIRHSKQGRTSGPVKPVHNEEPPKAPNAKKSSAPSKDGVTLLEKARKREDGVLRTDPSKCWFGFTLKSIYYLRFEISTFSYIIS